MKQIWTHQGFLKALFEEQVADAVIRVARMEDADVEKVGARYGFFVKENAAQGDEPVTYSVFERQPQYNGTVRWAYVGRENAETTRVGAANILRRELTNYFRNHATDADFTPYAANQAVAQTGINAVLTMFGLLTWCAVIATILGLFFLDGERLLALGLGAGAIAALTVLSWAVLLALRPLSAFAYRRSIRL